jgi:hypothetical protein
MEPPFLRLLIQEKLADGRLPIAPLPRAWGGPGNGQTCDGCSEPVTEAQTVVEHLDGPGRGVSVSCRVLSRLECRASGGRARARRPSSGSLRIQSRRRPTEPPMGATRAGGTPDPLRVPLALECDAARWVGR